MDINYPKYDFLPLTIIDWEKCYLTSDTHLGHANIIKYANRPYFSVYDMDADIINKWNSVVPKDALVFHLGDFSFYNAVYAKEIIKKLNGTIVLIKGNHDRKQNILSDGVCIFDKCYTQLEIKVPSTLVQNNHILLSHKPIDCDRNINLHGHCHGTYGERDNHLDVGVDVHNFEPISLAHAIKTVIDNNKKINGKL